MVNQSTPALQNFAVESSTPLGTMAYEAIQKHFKKTIKQKKLVLRDSDPESLHQMRVGIRRLRTAFEVFGPAVQVPEAITDRQLSKLAKRLGKVRDIDVLLLWLQTYRQTHELTSAERTHVSTLEQQLQTKRQHCFQRMQKYLKGKAYKALVAAFKDWLQSPAYGPIAAMSLGMVLPDLLLPLVSEVMQHPGWLVATKTNADGSISPLKRMGLSRINQCLNEQGLLLHDLRKRMKHVRYQTEFFLDQYGLSYAAQVKEFRKIQDVLGILQDEAVISDFLNTSLGLDWAEQLPSLDQQFEQERRETWREWQNLQTQYLNPAFRHALRQQIITPASVLSEVPDKGVTEGG